MTSLGVHLYLVCVAPLYLLACSCTHVRFDVAVFSGADAGEVQMLPELKVALTLVTHANRINVLACS